MTITLDTPIKFLREDGSATHANKESYPVNRWMRVKGPLEPCENGYHYTTPQHWRKWLTTRIHLLEAKEPLFREDKFCARGIKLQPRLTTWTPRTVALFAADCAERVLPIFERAFPDDPRPRQAIMVVRSGSASEASEAPLPPVVCSELRHGVALDHGWHHSAPAHACIARAPTRLPRGPTAQPLLAVRIQVAALPVKAAMQLLPPPPAQRLHVVRVRVKQTVYTSGTLAGAPTTSEGNANGRSVRTAISLVCSRLARQPPYSLGK